MRCAVMRIPTEMLQVLGPSHVLGVAAPDDVVFRLALSNITNDFKRVCPWSLMHGGSCPNKNCTLLKLCEQFNIQSENKTWACPKWCRQLHMYKTCFDEAMGRECEILKKPQGLGKFICSFAVVIGAVLTICQDRKSKQATAEHRRCRAHGNNCLRREWKCRMALVQLVDYHVHGKYMGLI